MGIGRKGNKKEGREEMEWKAKKGGVESGIEGRDKCDVC